MSQALYRTYRSTSLAEIVGQEHITQTLDRAIKAGRISHAYLFTGPRGVGKTSVARILAHQINSLPYSSNHNLDIIEIDAASNRRIDDIRDLRDKVNIAPVHAKYKVYIIDEVHMLTGESFNALLKTLEEPPKHVVFILATTEVHKLPATIISRTQRYSFKPGQPQQIANHLEQIAQKEKINIDGEALQLIAERSDGSFRDSLSMLDQLTHISESRITAAQVAEVLGLASKESIADLTNALINQDLNKTIKIINELEKQGSSVLPLIDQLTRHLLDNATSSPNLLPLINSLIEVPRAYNPKLKLVAALASHCANNSQQQPLASQKTPAPAIAKKEVKPLAKQTQPPKEQEQPKPKEPQTVIKNSLPPLTSLTDSEWQSVLQEVRQTNPPLYAIIKQAEPTLENSEITLQFKYALHSKKLDDVKQKTLLAQLIAKSLNKAATIKVEVVKKTDPIATITEIMGGGTPL